MVRICPLKGIPCLDGNFGKQLKEGKEGGFVEEIPAGDFEPTKCLFWDSSQGATGACLLLLAIIKMAGV